MTRNAHIALRLATVLVAVFPLACQKDGSGAKAMLLRYARDMSPGETVTGKDVTPIELDEDAVPGLGDPVPYEHIHSLAAKPLCVHVTKNQWVLQKHFIKDPLTDLEKFLPPSRPAGSTTRATSRP